MPAGHCGSRVVNGALGLQGDLPLYPSHAGLCDGWHSFRGFNNRLTVLESDDSPALEVSALCLCGRASDVYIDGEAGRHNHQEEELR